MASAGKRSSIQWFVLAASLTALILGGFWLYSVLSEVGLNAFLPGGNGTHSTTVKLKPQAIYYVKKKLDLLDMRVIRVISKQQPQEFLIVDGVASGLVDKVFAKEPDLVWANLMANQLLRLREVGDGASSPVSIEIQDLKTLNAGFIQNNQHQLPYWQIEIRFKLSNEPNSRFYQAGVLRNADGSHSESGKDTLLVGYAQKEAFQKPLMNDLLNQLIFERN
ncbi:hypothetical protein [Vampirovibrio sp.]|uniref:hypothetical protein n=1 Tax=Vampirovibrio sp. TaxID=2717857 RepID=UPI0035938627